MTKPALIKAVVFDLDGLLFDTEMQFFKVASEYLQEHGKVFTLEIMRAMIGRQARESSLALQQMSGIDADPIELLTQINNRFLERLDSVVHPMPGLFSLLANLEKRQIPTAIATSSGRAYADRLLRNHHLTDRFKFALCREDVTQHKPNPEVYQSAASRLGVEPAETLVLEDSPTGLAAARAAGTFAVGVPHDYCTPEMLSAADLLIDRLDNARLIARIDQGRQGN